jgi:hypothetical protein
VTSAKGQHRKPKGPRRPAPDRAVSERWFNDQQDPANWLRVPEFEVRPADVAFEGFAFPILYPNAPMREMRENVRDLVRLARGLVVKECSTRKDQLTAFGEWLDGEPLTPRRYAAAAYSIVMQRLEHALEQTEPLVRIEIPGERGVEECLADAMQALSLAALMLTEWSLKDPKAQALTRAMVTDEMKKAMLSELGKKGRQKSLRETEGMKAQTLEWCRAQRANHASLNALARAAVNAKLNVAAYSTVRGWLTEWKKNAAAENQHERSGGG